ncbi:MAG: CDP-alcohol phosphatidyltransferase family protein [Candidatus Omnitrophica bacterium]|nr:CDP-alcohol phosphatidyltransferase family protein [Candidatus Omnitrophota bacterium]
MVESLKELNKICQKPRYKEVGNWMVRHILRDAALPITWLLLHTPVTANQVTLVSLLIGLWGIFFFSVPGSGFFLLGSLLLQLWYYLDHVEGQIARYRKTACLTGRFFDFLTHHIIHGVIFFSLGFYAFHATGLIFFILWGALTSFLMMIFNLLQDTKYKTFFEKLMTTKTIQIKGPDDKAPSENRNSSKKKPGIFSTAFSFFHKLSEIHVLMNILTIASILQVVMKLSYDLRLPLLAVYGLVTPVLAVSKSAYWIKYRKIDADFENNFSLSDHV